MGIFREWIQNIVIFLLMTAMAGQLIPDEKYKKYIRLTMGLLLIMVILRPLTRLSGMDEEFYENFMKENFRISAEDARTGTAVFGADERVDEGYKQLISKEVTAYFEAESMMVRYCEADMNENSSDEHYGEIEGLRIGILPKDRAVSASGKGTDAGSEGTDVEAVAIPEVRIGAGEKAGERKSSVPAAKSEQWLKTLSLQFGVDREQIELEILT